MTVFKKIAAAVLGLSFVTFVALFGRLPTFRSEYHPLIWRVYGADSTLGRLPLASYIV